MKMSKNSRKHYYGVPTTDELLYTIGEFSAKFIVGFAVVSLILWLL